VLPVFRPSLLAAALCLATLPAVTHAQTAAAPPVPVHGTWRVEGSAIKNNGPREVIIRADSSASWGKETVRWRLPAEGRIMIALGGEWETYRMKLKGDKLTLSGGDLTEPITLKRAGPPTPRPDGVAIPGDPDTEQ